nr:hypothetical protein GCM10025732_29720 [Glycomyces mayteni]
MQHSIEQLLCSRTPHSIRNQCGQGCGAVRASRTTDSAAASPGNDDVSFTGEPQLRRLPAGRCEPFEHLPVESGDGEIVLGLCLPKRPYEHRAEGAGLTGAVWSNASCVALALVTAYRPRPETDAARSPLRNAPL